MFRRLFFLVFICTPALSLEIWFFEGSERIVSPSSIFELGLFKDGTGWYLGIWFRQFPGRVVWTGRHSLLYSSKGNLQISSSGIQLYNETGYMTWYKNLTSPTDADAPLSAYLSDTGNFIVSNYSGAILWESFDYPSDVLIPGMVLGYYPGLDYARTITSDDLFFYEAGTETGYEQYIWGSGGTKICRIDPIYTAKAMVQARTNNSYTYSLRRSTTTSYHASLKMNHTGLLIWSEWTPEDREWKDLVIAPSDICDKYTTCGTNTNTYCSMNPLKSCECFPGFRSPTASERNQNGDASSGNCVRPAPMMMGFSR
ncbi:Receptor-like serine/threonine-protein kinase SD1-7 [Raphanus sativus]|nr:Receptor-like serine/threonine-protein kinase SD1-7 [Raphanus sativus]